jgi:topoisomerase-4 subunit A
LNINSDEPTTNDHSEDDSNEEIIKWKLEFEGAHFYDNTEEGDGNDTITKVTGMYKDWFWTMLPM